MSIRKQSKRIMVVRNPITGIRTMPNPMRIIEIVILFRRKKKSEMEFLIVFIILFILV
jgi:hypothetical protein